jgi:hypothetical protein
MQRERLRKATSSGHSSSTTDPEADLSAIYDMDALFSFSTGFDGVYVEVSSELKIQAFP